MIYAIVAVVAFVGGCVFWQKFGGAAIHVERDVTGEVVKVYHNGVEFVKRHI